MHQCISSVAGRDCGHDINSRSSAPVATSNSRAVMQDSIQVSKATFISLPIAILMAR